MTKIWYFVISNCGGDTSIRQLNEAELLRALNPDEDGDVGLDFSKALTEFGSMGTNYWRDGEFVIIKGEIVVPQVEQVVTRVTV